MREGPQMLEVNGLSKQFGGLRALSDVSFGIRKGEIMSLIGPNGAGKTTCLNLITGFSRPSAGSVHYCGNDITGLAPTSPHSGAWFEHSRRPTCCAA
jgi:branched-chain amino acid transport system ATP-binding protein